MKTIWTAFICLLPVLASAQSKHINKLIIDARKTYTFEGNDSTGAVTIDTLIMKNRSAIQLLNKKEFSLTINNAFIGNKASIIGTNGKNDGTNLIITANFKQIGDLNIDVRGVDAKIGNRKYDNGDGGKVTFNYLDEGIQPQFNDRKKPHYVVINNKAGGYLTNPRNDISNIFGRIGRGGRPLGQLPQGRVYSGSVGRDGKTSINKVDDMQP